MYGVYSLSKTMQQINIFDSLCELETLFWGKKFIALT